MLNDVLSLFSHAFVQRAFVVGILVSLCAALLGVILVLKNYSLIGHGLADIGFAALSLAVALGLSPLAVSMPVVIVSSFIIMAYSQHKGIAGDTAIGIATTAALAFGIIVTSLSSGFNIDVSNYMFGSILAMEDIDIILGIVLAIVVIGLFALFYNRLFLITCDETFAKAQGINVLKYQFLVSFLVAITVVIGMRMMGTLLISSLIIFPAISARKLANGFLSLVIVSAVISVIAFVVGILLSFMLNLPTGASIVLSNVIIMLLCSVVGKLRA
ncbi:metal ABC transporter permease [Eubacteriales bacterium OttesenSCG-928-N14]|nr:metal ABC transporter permease [Eubacteriales bacterium OttesenSCG-928-N14]